MPKSLEFRHAQIEHHFYDNGLTHWVQISIPVKRFTFQFCRLDLELGDGCGERFRPTDVQRAAVTNRADAHRVGVNARPVTLGFFDPRERDITWN